MFSSPVASSAQSLACVCVTGTNMGDFQEASNLIQSHIGQLIETNTSKVPKDLVARILGPAQDVIKILDSIKHIHPVLATVTGVFTTLIQLEIERRENDKRIVMLQLRMTDLLLVLSSLKDTFTAAGELKMMLDRFLQAVHRTLADVHKSCDTYYERGTISRMFRSKSYKKLFAGFTASFEQHEKDLCQLMTYRTAATTTQIDAKIDLLLKK